jgi:beta-glucosidase
MTCLEVLQRTGAAMRRAEEVESPPGRRGRVRAPKVLLAGLVAVACGAAPAAAQAPDRPWMDRSLSADERAGLLLDAMTLEEKVELMTGDQGGAPAAYYNAPIERLGIPELRMADAGAGIANRGWELPGTGASATAMPSSIALAATFDRQAVRRYSGVVADEARETGHEMLLGPNADPVRQPFWGRIAESAGEDPLLSARVNTPFVQEVQRRNVIADLKHYIGYAQETLRGGTYGPDASGEPGIQNSIIGERALHEVHALPYADAIRDADLGSVMCSFNRLNGTYVCENDYALQTVLRDELGFTGFVITDFGAIHSTEASVRAGTDLETGTRTFYDGPLLEAVRAGRVPEALVDRSVRRILRTMFAVGVFDTEYAASAIPVAQHGQVAEDVQAQAVTLLKDDRRALPLDAAGLRSLAVIGADATITSAAGGASRVTPTYQRPLVQALRDRGRAAGFTVRYRAGNDPVNAANMIEAPDMTAVPSSALSPDSGGGGGLTASYFPNTTLEGSPALTRTESQVLYDTGFTGGQPAFANLYASQRTPTPVVGANPLGGGQSVRYSGFLTAPGTGTYRLGLTGWGDARVWLDDRQIIDMTGQDGLRDVRSAALELRRGERHAIRVEYSAIRPFSPTLDPGTLVLQWSTPATGISRQVRRAARAAGRSDAAVVYVRTYESEQRDRLSLKLPQNAGQLIREVRRANPNTVVVVASGGPVTMPWADRVPAVVENYFGGQEEGDALARVLFGDQDPSGRLPVTFPRTEQALPPGVRNPWSTWPNPDVTFSEDVNIGYRGYIAAGVRPRWPFGHGLSYATFAYNRLQVSGLDATGSDDTARVRLRLTNTGERTGTEVVQVYVGPPAGQTAPARRLAGWSRVDDLEAGEQTRVDVDLDRREFSYWDSGSDRWVTPTGDIPVYVGSSATDARLTGTIRVG